jgi:nucleotide-binding universal stress UspA family protein
MDTILLAYDDSPSGEFALERAAELTARLGSKLIVITVAPTDANLGRGGGRIDPVDSPARRDQILAGARACLTAHGVEAEYALSIGRPADVIVHAAKQYGADLIIVGRRSTNPVKRMLRESVSELVLHKARCNVLVSHASKGAAKAINRGTDQVTQHLL